MEYGDPGDSDDHHLAVGSYRTTRLVHASRKTTVYLAESSMGDTVALKQCTPLQAERERSTLMALKRADPDCTHVVRLKDFVPGDPTAANPNPLESLVLEAASTSLEAWLRSCQHRPTWVEVLHVGDSVGRALEWLHAQGLCHTDIKPSNVLCVGGGRSWKLCDFAGAAKEGARSQEGTFEYCAPEQAQALLAHEPLLASYDADIWAYSKLLYEMAAGSPDALISQEASTSISDARALQALAQLKDPVVVESKLRFPVLRSVLALSVHVQKSPMNSKPLNPATKAGCDLCVVACVRMRAGGRAGVRAKAGR
jgi:serine/threonine protein kinase